MFSTLLGPLPPDPDRPRIGDGAEAIDRRLDDVVALGAAGLELVSDGAGPAGPDDDPAAVVGRWEAAAAASAVPVKQVILGPWSAAGLGGSRPEPTAERLRATILALAAAGCPFVEVAEPDALSIQTNLAHAALFGAAQRRLVDGTEGVHLSLALGGGNVDGAPAATFFDAPYASYAFDLIAGPDNWRLIVQAPADRGIICGALGMAPDADDTLEVLVWAAHYAASTNGRGLARVGLANAPTAGDAHPPTRAEALRKLAIVAEASRIASVESAEEMAGLLDPRAIDPRSAASGRFAPARRRGKTGGSRSSGRSGPSG